MIGLDTNVLVRYLTQDDPEQAEIATRVFEERISQEEPGFIGIVVLVETVWVLQRRYRVTPSETAETVRDLLGSRSLVVENRAAVAAALALMERAGAAFPDALVAAAASRAGCERIVTFDRHAERADMTLLA